MGRTVRLGRPEFPYSHDLALEICAHLASGKSLKSFCAKVGKPSRDTVYKWLFERQDFADLYARARGAQADTLADEVIHIGMTTSQKTAHRDRVRMDAFKWAAAKLAPRKYGDKQQIEHKGSVPVDDRPSKHAPEWLKQRLDGGDTKRSVN